MASADLDPEAPQWRGCAQLQNDLHVDRIQDDLRTPRGLPETGTVEVWYAPVVSPPGKGPFGVHPASAEDLRRARRFRSETSRTRFLSARRALRSLLAGYLSVQGTGVVLSADQRGKLHLGNPAEADGPISFNVAHSGDWIALAFGTGGAVGIDLEVEGRLPDLDALARRILSPKEIEEFLDLPPELRPTLFFQAWTRKEAFLKALGVGLSLPPSQVPTGLGPEPTALRRLSSPVGEADDGEGWTVSSLPAPPGYAAAVSFQGLGGRVRVMEGPRPWLTDAHSIHSP